MQLLVVYYLDIFARVRAICINVRYNTKCCLVISMYGFGGIKISKLVLRPGFEPGSSAFSPRRRRKAEILGPAGFNLAIFGRRGAFVLSSTGA